MSSPRIGAADLATAVIMGAYCGLFQEAMLERAICRAGPSVMGGPRGAHREIAGAELIMRSEVAFGTTRNNLDL
jgi:hypothetical protein